MNTRITSLISMLPENADAAIIISNENRRYFTDFVSSLGYLVVTREKTYLLVDSRYEEAAGKQAKNCTVVPFRKLSDSLGDIINCHKIKNVLLEGSAFTLNDAADIDRILSEYGAVSEKSRTLDDIICKQRIIKTADETDKMLKAQRITEKALKAVLRNIKEGMTEKDIALDLEFIMRKSGADSVSFDLIALAGENTSMPHGVPSERRIKKGDLLLFDIGATVDGYHSDMTRTYAFGYASDKVKRVYDTVLKAQLNALAAVHSGAKCSEIDKAAREYIDNAGYQGLFGHSTGHGVGLEIHEAPSVSPKNDFILQSGMVITVEPGIYIPGEFGIRIEDMVIVTNDGCINLAAMPKELTII
ncbi:MAG: aminopeptidase P family protein [Clostridia bacterium]|nr:aminopeptidase P family protein [Clostridia bacterium]